MPKYLGKILVVTEPELVPRFHPTYNALKLKLYRDEKRGYGYERAMRGGNFRELLVKFDSLPKRIQEAIGDPRILENPLQLYYKELGTVDDYYNDFTYPDGKYLRQVTLDKQIINANVLLAVLKLEITRINERIAKNSSAPKKGILSTLYTDVHNFNAILLKQYEYQHTLNSNEISFRRQFKAFKDAYSKSEKEAFKSLIKDANGKGRNNAKKRNDKTDKLLMDLFAGRDWKPNPTQVAKEYEAFLNGYIEVIDNETGEIYEAKDYPELSSSAITSFLAKWEVKIGTHAKRSGNRQQLLQDFIPYESMERPTLAGSIISIDDRQPPFWYEKGKRMWWYIGIDLASEAIVAWSYGKTKEELIKNFYKNMVTNFDNWNVQLPAELECESSLNSSFKKTFLKDGTMFEKVNIHANSARSKMIERFFRDMRYELEKNNIGWIARPFAKDEANQASTDKKTIVPYKKLVEQCFSNIMLWNNMPKKGTTIGRFDYFLQNQNPDLRQTNYKSFVQHLGTKTISSCNAGIVKLQRSEWLLGDKGTIYTGEKLINLLKQVEGKDINLCWLDDDNGKVYKALMYDRKEERYIGEVLSKPKSARAFKEETEEQRKNRTLMAKYRNTVTSFMQVQKNNINKVTVIDNRPITVSSTFTIPGVTMPKIKDNEETEVLEEFEDDFSYTPKQTSNKNSLEKAFGL
ncbi:hypothetical protein G1L22_12910 [Tenacibaculum finnmarkense]|uniref:hypothetical protein n=1 Tax=Tenacibaculum finnmarkense TaxID=2781243 RepID=UPI00187BB526|nr:hypothetical protein [Tenacibaculum finnmarkense]MDB0599692.1 hypothetical protein [Tenacibaculum maritimum]MBE7649185.1 hypothetical protein [Tenacibaculum finnmarkense genomovar ulcerans]MCG8740004.1 hypothetical protein [Tenacibaculum finnmarkense]MCG8762108.1 hypothetical protein [Tenacibaculum finnmarkense]MCG8781614.1 hypothetical protein [Tenacibaculum finnmarkense]